MDECEKIIERALEDKRVSLLTNEAQQICDLHHIPTPKSLVALNVEDAIEKAQEINYPVALKVLSPQILHKSNVGGVILNIGTEGELKTEYEKMLADVRGKEPSAKIMGVLVEKMMPSSIEMIIGGIRDAQFGPAVMFGVGGIFTEVYDDVTFRVAPLDRIDALNMIHGLKGSKVLEGIRGRAPADEGAIMKVLFNVSNIMVEHDRINQLDLNPVIAYSNSVCAVDSRIIIKGR
jgi:acetyl-CoA synthetase (ADP-forming)